MNEGIDGALGFPPTLSLPDQGRFAIGYYHQRQAFYPNTTKP
jgi:CRISPR-associated protein Csd1